METTFAAMLNSLVTEKMTVQYIKGGGDKHFGNTYTGAYVAPYPGCTNGHGLYYIAALDRFFYRHMREGKIDTKYLSISREEQLPRVLVMLVEEVVERRQSRQLSPAEVAKELKERKVLYKSSTGTYKETKPVLLSGQRFLVIGKRASKSA